MTNSTPWQTVANTNNNPAFPLTKISQPSVLNTENKQKANQGSKANKAMIATRYSFDDNGGSYMGL